MCGGVRGLLRTLSPSTFLPPGMGPAPPGAATGHAALPSGPAQEGAGPPQPLCLHRVPGRRGSPRGPIRPQRLRLRRGVQEGPGRGAAAAQLRERPPPTARPAAAHPPVSAPESTQSSSSPPPFLGSMVRSLPRSVRGRWRDPGRAPSGPPRPAQPLPSWLGSLGASRCPGAGRAPPHRAAPSPGRARPGTGCRSRPAPPLAARRCERVRVRVRAGCAREPGRVRARVCL